MSVVLFLFLGNIRGALIVAMTIPFSLMFASICLDLGQYSRQSALAGRAGFRDGGGRRRGDGREHHPPPGREEDSGLSVHDRIRAAAHEVQRPVFYAIGDHHHGLSADLHSAAGRGPSFPADGVDGRLRLAGRAAVSRCLIAPVLASLRFATARASGAIRSMNGSPASTVMASTWAVHHRWVTVGMRWSG